MLFIFQQTLEKTLSLSAIFFHMQVKGAIYCQEGLVFLPEFGERNGKRMVKFSRETSG